jgi:hypothetical protein
MHSLRLAHSLLSGEMQPLSHAERDVLRSAHPRLDALDKEYGPMEGIAPKSSCGGLPLKYYLKDVHLRAVGAAAAERPLSMTKKIPGGASGVPSLWCMLPIAGVLEPCASHCAGTA